MPGFFGIINNFEDVPEMEIPNEFYRPVVCDERKGHRYYFKRHVIPKFLNDKVFDENEAIFVGTDGILFNSPQLRKKYGVDTNFALIERIYSDHGIEGISEIKGNFSGFVLNKKSHVLHVFTDHMGSKALFYFFDEERKYLVFGSELKIIVTIMRKLGYTPCLSEPGAYCLLTFGFMIADNTLVKEIKKIPPGSILSYSNGQIKIDQYYKFSCSPEVTDSEETIVKKVNSLYLEAIKLEYEKDLEYNYSHIATLSGGLDSRMNVMNAKKSGYSDIVCVCFSQSNYLDEVIAKKIASDQGFDFIFHALDNGNYLKNIDEAVFVNDGLTVYPGSSPLQHTLRLLDSTKLGLLHTGLLWFGPWKARSVHTPVNRDIIEQIAYSRKLLDEIMIRDLVIPQNYENEEIFCLYERGTNCLFNGYRITEQFTEFSSPLHDKDFLAYALRVPPQENNSLYMKWILSEIPEAAEYPWERTGVKINDGFLKRLGYRIYRFIFKKHFRNKMHKDAMNPEEYWYNTNPSLKDAINSYYTKNIGILSKHPSLMKDAQRLFIEGNVREKTQVLTLLAAMKLHLL
jgi:asparagine synthase (glutamine-hydrolysing)